MAIRRFWSELGELVELDYHIETDVRDALATKMGIQTTDLHFGPRKSLSPKV
jgi:hypothetical protein